MALALLTLGSPDGQAMGGGGVVLAAAVAVLVVAVAQALAAGPVVVEPELVPVMEAEPAVTHAVITRHRRTLPRNHHRRRGGPLPWRGSTRHVGERVTAMQGPNAWRSRRYRDLHGAEGLQEELLGARAS
jgi:hypothetical protein